MIIRMTTCRRRYLEGALLGPCLHAHEQALLSTATSTYERERVMRVIMDGHRPSHSKMNLP